MAETTRRIIDWDLIEADWRAGVKTKQQMAAQYEVSRAAMDKHFARLGIVRDLGEKIRAKAESLVARAAVTQQVTPESAVAERDIIAVNATMQSQIVLAHRTDIQRSRRLTMALLAELEHQTDNVALYQQLADLLYEPDERGVDKRNELFTKVIGLQSRTGTMKSLADALKTLIGLEREAFGLEARQDDGNSGVEAVIKRVMAKVG